MRKFLLLILLLGFTSISYSADATIKGMKESRKGFTYVIVNDSGYLVTNISNQDTSVEVTNFPDKYQVWSDSYADIISAINSITNDTNVYVINFPIVQSTYDTQLESLTVTAVSDSNVYVVNFPIVQNTYDTQLESLTVTTNNDTNVVVTNFPVVQKVYFDSACDTIAGKIDVDVNNLPSVYKVYSDSVINTSDTIAGSIDVKPMYLTCDYDTNISLDTAGQTLSIGGYFEIWGDTDVILDWNGVEHTLPLSVLRVYKSDYKVDTLTIKNANGLVSGSVDIIKVGR